jgi:adenylate cyclase
MVMSNPTRQLSAIMFTDIVGYTALMGSNEKQAMSVLKTNRDIHKRIIKKHNGRWLKEMGDGTLASYHTISDAVYCAGALINACNTKGIELRIGIHLGDVVEEDGDIFGDGVNVASRLEQVASPNQIIVSAPIHRDIKNKNGITSTFIEEKQLKNVDEPVRIYSVEVTESGENQDSYTTTKQPKSFLTKQMLLGMIAVLVIVLGISYFFNPLGEIESTSDVVENAGIKKSIAVLPFKDMSPEQDQEYLGDGFAEDIINRLTKVEDLKVIGRTSSFSFKNKDTDLKTIGEKLGVETILAGSVQKSGKQLRITVQLINAEDASHIWSEQFDRKFSDVFSIQDELAHLVVSKMKAVITPEEKNLINSKPTENSDALIQYWLGRESHDRASRYLEKSYHEKAILHYKKAYELDPNFAHALAGMAQTIWDKDYSDNFYNEFVVDTVKYLCDKALSINANLAEGYYTRALCHRAKSNYDEQQHDLLEAIKYNPNYTSAYLTLGEFLFRIQGRYPQALNSFNKAFLRSQNEELASIFAQCSWLFLEIGMFDKAEYFGRKEKEIINRSIALFWTYIFQGKFQQAKDEANLYQLIYPNQIQGLWHLAIANLYLDRLDDAQTYFTILIDQFESESENHRLNRYRNRYGFLLNILGDSSLALQQFELSNNFLKSGELLGRNRARDNTAYNLAANACYLNNIEEAFIWLNKMKEYGWHWGYPFHIERDPMFDNLKNNPEFISIVKMAQDEKAIESKHVKRLIELGELELLNL